MGLAYKRTQPFVHAVTPTRGKSIYGYQTGTQWFLKIELFNHVFVSKSAELLNSGRVLMPLQPFEAHIPYLLHFMADYNLAGCNYIQFDRWERKSNISLIDEVDVMCTDIIESTTSSQLNIDSLRELQIQDSAVRAQVGVDQYVPTLERPETEEIHLEWENYERMVDDLRVRLEVLNDLPKDSLISASQSHLSQQASSQPSQLSQSSLKPLAKSSLRELSLEEEVSMTVEPVTQEDADRSFALAQEGLKEHGNWIDTDTANTAMRFCNSQLDGPSAKVLLTAAPTTEDVVNTVGIEHSTRPFYRNPADKPFFAFTHANKEFKLGGNEPSDLPQFKFGENVPANLLLAVRNDYEMVEPKQETHFQLASLPPTRREVVDWQSQLEESQKQSGRYALASMPSFLPDDELTILCIEVITSVRKGKTPYSEEDPIVAIAWSNRELSGIITTADMHNATQAPDELGVINALIDLVHKLDPDLLIGYETNAWSWGYVAARYTEITDEIIDLGRLIPGNVYNNVDAMVHPGRYLLNLWYLLRHEVTLPKYNLEVAIYNVFHHPIPRYSYDDLYQWWLKGEYEKVADYYLSRVQYTIKLMDHIELISKYSEQARIIGIDFYSSLTRGSQFKVESVLCRLSKRKGYRLISPSRGQVGQQAALEWIPLVMEPKSDIYTDPVCVLDFRSLYPSIVIAFNLCYSTCIGRLRHWKGKNKLGVLEDHAVPPGLSFDDIFIAPNGIGYVKPKLRKSVIATMLSEILECRFMIKSSMKFNKSDTRYQRNLNSKQMALKFIANVTYGYVSASFTGRMPCAEIADTIVSTGRELLIKSINIIESQDQWGIKPKVVYGDTDSLFVKLPGASKEQAFTIGKELAAIVTSSFPSPVELEMEKVYKPCILLTKKRYVGLSYDSPHAQPKFDAKGTETIRRDGTPIEQKLEKGALDRIFADSDLSSVKKFLQVEWRKILDGDITLRDFCFSQQVKLGSYTGKNLPGGAVVSLKKAENDQGSLPQFNERVSYVVKAGTGNRTDRVVLPEELVNNPKLTIDSDYYIPKNILPPLERMFNIFGADVRSWYTEMPKPNRSSNSIYKSQCVVCLNKSREALCERCAQNPVESLYITTSRENLQEQKVHGIEEVCFNCSGRDGVKFCRAMDCDTFFDRERARNELKELRTDRERVELQCEW